MLFRSMARLGVLVPAIGIAPSSLDIAFSKSPIAPVDVAILDTILSILGAVALSIVSYIFEKLRESKDFRTLVADIPKDSILSIKSSIDFEDPIALSTCLVNSVNSSLADSS